MRLAPLLLLLLVGCSGDRSKVTSNLPTDDVVVDTDPGITEDTDQAGDTDVDPRAASVHQRSGELVFSSDGRHLYVVDRDNGDVLVVHREDRRVAAVVPVGDEPHRLVRRGDAVWVTLRMSGELVRLREDGDRLVEEHRRVVGAEPWDVVASQHSDRLFVSLSQEDAVVSLDPSTLEERDRWSVAGEPRWMAVTEEQLRDDEGVFVASAMRPTVTAIDPVQDLTRVLELPERPRFTDAACDDRMLSRRITGELDLSFDGAYVYVAALYADTVVSQEPAFGDTAIPAPPDGDCPQMPDDIGARSVSGYGGKVRVEQPTQLSRFEPVVVQLALSDDVDSRLIHVATAGMSPQGIRTRRGYPRGLSVSRLPDRDASIWVTQETTGLLMRIDPNDPAPAQDVAPGFVVRGRASSATDGGPVSPRVGPGALEEVWLLSWTDRRIEQFAARDFSAVEATGARPNGIHRSLSLPPSELRPEVLAGRRLFYGADMREMTGPNTGTSCTSCHDEGRTDGFTWDFPDMPRQTPSLAGPVSQTTPVTWTGEVETVGLEAELTTLLRMGGDGPSDEQKLQIEAFVDSIRAPVRPQPSTLEEQARADLGEEIFRRPEVGCATCHVGALGTDRRQHALFGLPTVDTPRLQGVGASPPYLHDGSAATLRDVVLRARDGSMGDTSSLTDDEIDALVAFLAAW